MTLEHQAAQAQQRRAIETAVVHAVLEALEHGHRQQRRQLGQPVAAELFADDRGDHRRQPFGRLQSDIADETVAHHQIGRALEDVVALHIAVEVQLAGRRRLAEQLARALDRLVALDRLFADVQQAHRRLGLAVHRRNQGTAHHGELQQMLGGAIDIRAQIEHGGEAARLIGHDGRDGRAVDAVQRFEQVARHGHQGAGVACRHAGIGKRRNAFVRLELADGHPH